MLAGVLSGPATLELLPEEVAYFRESVRRGIAFVKDNITIQGNWVTMFEVQDVEAEKPEDDCNT